MNRPLVSIIIPTFNREAQVKNALNSIKSQTYDHWECIVVDDGSIDDSVSVLKAFNKKDSRFLFYNRSRDPKGAPTCRNIGLQFAKGEYVIFLDSDDYLLPFCLEQRVEAINEFPDCDFLVFPMAVDKNGDIKKQQINEYEDYLIPFLSANLPWQTMCPIWKISFLQTLNGFSEGYPRFNDPELMIRALLYKPLKFKVFNDKKFDTVHIPSIKEPNLFKEDVFNSLMLFIPDTVKHLEAKNAIHYKPYLALYLHLWFKYIYIPSGDRKMKKPIKLIGMFNKLGIISSYKTRCLNLRLFLYSMSTLIFRKPFNKLSGKELYI